LLSLSTIMSCPAEGGIPGVYAPHGVLLDAAGALQTRYAQTVQTPFSAASPVLGCVPMGIPPFVLPRLAGGGGKRRGNCLRAKPEFFRVPPSARSKGSPQGQDWLGCLFLVSSFGHAKEEKENRRKASRLSPEFPDEPNFPYAVFFLRRAAVAFSQCARNPPLCTSPIPVSVPGCLFPPLFISPSSLHPFLEGLK